MSTAKYSGIAVAAANRAALERQEAEAERLRAPRAVDAREKELLEHLRATMTAESLLGATKRPDARALSRAPESTPRATANADASSSGRAALVAQKAVERASRARAHPTDALAPEKRHMSKAERKRLKRERAARAEAKAEAEADAAPRVRGATRDDDDGRRAKKRRKKVLSTCE